MDDERRETDARQQHIPRAILRAAHRSPHLLAAARTYIATGDTNTWSRAHGELRRYVERLMAECARRGSDVPAVPVGPWPEGTPDPGSALTPVQASALVYATEAHGMLVGAVAWLMELDPPAPIVVPAAEWSR